MSLADLALNSHGSVVVAHLDGEIDMSNANELGDAISRQVPNEATGVVLDFSRVGYVDSAGIQTIFELHERLQTRGQRMRLVVPPGSAAAAALELADVQGAIGSLATLDEAVAAIQ